jgi:hypothetical protein
MGEPDLTDRALDGHASPRAAALLAAAPPPTASALSWPAPSRSGSIHGGGAAAARSRTWPMSYWL